MEGKSIVNPTIPQPKVLYEWIDIQKKYKEKKHNSYTNK